jgi:hypothetical protein
MEKTAVEFLVETLAENGILHSSDIEQAKEIEENLAEQYADYRIIFDRHAMKPIKFKHWCKQYNETFKNNG